MSIGLYAIIISAGYIIAKLLDEGAVTSILNRKNKIATGEICSYTEFHGLTSNEGLIISENVRLNEKASREHVGIIGPTGAGKTTSEFFPNLLSDSISRNSSIVVSDPKGELYCNTANYQRKLGREPLLFAPLNPEYSLCYNPLEICVDVTEVRELAQNLLMNGALSLEISTGKKAGGTEWIQMAAPLFVASLLYCKRKGRPMNNISEAFKLIINHTAEELDALFSNSSEDVKVQYNIFKSSAESPRTMSSIKVTFASNLQLFTDPKLIQVTKKCDFYPSQLRRKPICLYIMYPERKANYLSPFTSCFYSQLINKTLDYFNEDSLPIYYFWDEFANVGQLSNFAQNIATVRSRNMNFVICLQGFTQLIQIYGRDNAMAILNNLKTKIVFPGLTDIETLNIISSLCGYTELEVMSYSVSRNENDKVTHNTTTSKTRKKLLEIDEIRRLENDKVLIIAHNRQPVIDFQNIYYKQERYTKNIQTVRLAEN